jgi:hypothetical protein
MEVSGQLYPQGKSPRYPLDRRLCESQSRCGRGGEKKIPSPRQESNPRTPIVQPVGIDLYKERIMIAESECQVVPKLGCVLYLLEVNRC